MITIIVAFDDNRVMGTESGELPWHIPAEFKWFKKTTMGCPVIMGRKTWESLPKRPLPGRLNIVVSRSRFFADAVHARSIEEAIQKGREEINRAHREGAGKRIPAEVFILGGLEVYKASLGLVDRVLVSHIKGTHEGSVYFPPLKDWPGEWWGKCVESHEQFDVVEYTK